MARDSDLDVAYVARLARLNLTKAETELFQKQHERLMAATERHGLPQNPLAIAGITTLIETAKGRAAIRTGASSELIEQLTPRESNILP